ncbi:hypothetical protein CPB83DRAFT_857176 [Crepidotus variabilis]|uniref:Uncharacterized protein n=1 Tax=Crepidotus variabilis TaxID=179855 RepID=A0A9P6ED81_9AGAR|nr:hypothetical protein CPB83DRAFT_857176 [Crepidotus variabilis]
MSLCAPPSPSAEIVAHATTTPIPGSIFQWPSEAENVTYFDPSDFYVAYKSFDLQDQPFEELPESIQRFLLTTGLYPKQFQNIQAFFKALLETRTARRHRLERTLEGVSKSIVREMLASHFRTGNSTLDEQCKPVLRDVLQPEWRDHLDSYVEEIDALIWLDMTARENTPEQPSWEQYMTERRGDIESMVDFALQCLQNAFEKVRMERKARWLLEEITRGSNKNVEDRFSEAGAESNGSDEEEDQWVKVSATTESH